MDVGGPKIFCWTAFRTSCRSENVYCKASLVTTSWVWSPDPNQHFLATTTTKTILEVQSLTVQVWGTSSSFLIFSCFTFPVGRLHSSTLAPKPKDVIHSVSAIPLKKPPLFIHIINVLMSWLYNPPTNLAFLFDTFSLHSFTFHPIDFDVLAQWKIHCIWRFLCA